MLAKAAKICSEIVITGLTLSPIDTGNSTDASFNAPSLTVTLTVYKPFSALSKFKPSKSIISLVIAISPSTSSVADKPASKPANVVLKSVPTSNCKPAATAA